MKNKYFYFIPYFLLANILFIASNIPLLLRVIKTPPAYIQFYDHMSIMSSDIFDYNQYLSAITQGKNGYFLYEDAFTSEKTKPGLFFTFYILLGQISRPFNLWPPIIYNLARILAVELFFIAVFILTASAVGMKHAFWASSVSIFATIAPYSYFSGIGSHSPYFLWYEFLVPTGRIDSPPHHILGQTLLLFSIYFIFLFIRGGRKKIHVLSASLCAFLSGFILTPCALMLMTTMTLSLVFYFVITVLSKRSTKNILHLVYGILPVVFASGLTLLIAYFQSQAGFPWNQWRTWEINMWNTSALLNKEFFLIFGLLPILSIPAVIYVLASFRFENIFILFWAIFPYLLLPFASLLGFGKVRLVNEAPYVPFAILYTFTLFHLTSGWQKLGRLFWRIGLIAIFLISIKPQLIPPLQAKINWTKGEMAGYTNIYLPKSMMVTINYLNKVELKNSVVLGDSRIGNFLPGYAPVRSFIGHPVLTKDYDRKNAELANFLRGSLTNSEANTFLKNNRISFIYFGQFEKEYGLKYLPYSSLIPEVETSDYILYKVI